MNNSHCKTNVLLIIPQCAGGVWTVVYNLLSNIDRRRFEPHLLVLKGKLNDRALNGLKVNALSVLPEEDTILDSSIKSFRNCATIIRRIIKISRAERIDVINTHSPVPTVLGYVASRFLKGTKLVPSLHNEFESLRFAMLASKGAFRRFCMTAIFLPFFRFILRRCQRICTVSKFEMARLLDASGSYAGKVVHIHPGQGNGSCRDIPEDVKAETSRTAPNRPRRVTSAGALVPIKGYEYLMRTIGLIAEKKRNVKFDIFGDGPLRQDLTQMTRKLGIEDCVTFHGYVNDALRRIAQTDIFVLSSLSEGMPCVLTEAMMMSKPIVATSVGGIPEMVEDGYNGYLVEPKDSAAMAERICHLLNNRDKALQMGENGRSLWSKMFTAETMSRKYESLYWSVIGNAVAG